jgi:hypothetical protein
MSSHALPLSESTEPAVGPAKTNYRRYGVPKRKRHLYLTDAAHGHLVSLASLRDSSPSEVAEQIIRAHQQAVSIPTAP